MKIGVIGAGHLGTSVGSAIAEGGHEVLLSSRHPKYLQDSQPNTSIMTIEECAKKADVILLATPYRALPKLAQQLAKDITNKVVLDATNPEPSDNGKLAETSRQEGMGVTTQSYLSTARVVRAFSSINAGNVPRSRYQSSPLAIPIAGDDPKAVEIAKQIVSDAGCTPVVTGDLASGRIFEWGNPGCFVNTNEARLRRIIGV
ncbi:hypothetical protein GCM10025886_13150 [Tetragenococcus halophilus subsp. flandriensis]|uniref:NADPH-dependent F420 reductase n=1 Tax=Tetragenococcus halophilus TaxID=51669 RepID=UPI0023EA3FAE|nr:NAD(P)-binding domain-containing protein [Tetragenococcus halophilus]GMA08164.1 hypothetical protein GCM10025886_13150 [Tetragenococcus halophilus subsp. flandriensis]